MNLETTAQDLRRKAQDILLATGWQELFTERFGTCALTGSAHYDLMVWPDIDIHMPVDPNRRIEWASMLADLNDGLERPGFRLHKAQMWDDYVDPHPLGAGLYWGIQFVDDGVSWKSDIWGWAPDDYARRQIKDAELAARLATANRSLILQLKTEAMARPDYYGLVVGSWDIYQAVLAGATSLAEVEQWKAGNPQW